MRVGFDLSKAHHADGIGTWQREMGRALAEQVEHRGEPVALQALSLTAPWSPTALGLIQKAMGSQASLFQWPGLSASTGGSGIARSQEIAGSEEIVISSAWAVPPGFGGTLFFVVHDLTFLTHPHCHTEANRLHCLAGWLRAALVAEGRFLAVSQATADVLSGWLPAEGRTSVIHNGVSPFWRPLERDEERDEVAGILDTSFTLRPDGFVLSVGSFEPRKNLDGLLTAHQRLPDELRQRFPLVLAGSQGWKNERLMARLDRDPQVRVLGRVSEGELLALYNGAAVFAYPSLAEGFGLPAAEALACGTAVLASNSSSLPEVVGKAAEMVDPELPEAISSALAKLLTDSQMRQDLADRGPAQAARFSWQKSAAKLLDLILDP